MCFLERGSSKTTSCSVASAPARRWANLMRQYWIPPSCRASCRSPDCPPMRVRPARRGPDRLPRHVGRGRPDPERLPAPRRLAVLRPQRRGRPALRLPRLEVRHDGPVRRHAVGAGREQLQEQGAGDGLPLRGAQRHRLDLHGRARNAAAAARHRAEHAAARRVRRAEGAARVQLVPGASRATSTPATSASCTSAPSSRKTRSPAASTTTTSPTARPRYEVVETEFGTSYGAYRPAEADTYYWRVAHFLFPFYTMIPTGVLGVQVLVRAWVPVDDEHTMFWSMSVPRSRQGRGTGGPLRPGDYRGGRVAGPPAATATCRTRPTGSASSASPRTRTTTT